MTCANFPISLSWPLASSMTVYIASAKNKVDQCSDNKDVRLHDVSANLKIILSFKNILATEEGKNISIFASVLLDPVVVWM